MEEEAEDEEEEEERAGRRLEGCDVAGVSRSRLVPSRGTAGRSMWSSEKAQHSTVSLTEGGVWSHNIA